MEYLSEIISFITGLGAGFTLHIATSRVSQNNNTVGGDIVGGNKDSSSGRRKEKDFEKSIKEEVEKRIKDKKG